METNWVGVATLIVAGIALMLSILGYRRSRTIDNENQLFNAKIQSYQIITAEIAKATRLVEVSTEQFKGLTALSNDEGDRLIETIANNLFLGLRQFRVNVAGQLFLLPAEINQKIELFYGSYLNDKTEVEPDLHTPFKELETAIDLLYLRANAVYDAIRQDLNIDPLHTKLLKRTTPVKYLS